MIYLITGLLVSLVLYTLLKKGGYIGSNRNLRKKVSDLDQEESALELREDYAEGKHDLNKREQTILKKEKKLEK